jgi:4-hydroxy-tetrahydrodipicolinate synthase
MAGPKQFRGVYVIVPTPFHADLSLDVEGLKNIVRFCVASGVHGVVAPANASEQPYLSESERRIVSETVAAEARGKTHLIVSVTANTAREAAALSAQAAELGADAIMAMPPYLHRPTEPEIRAYYAAIDRAATLPVFIQNWSGPGGTPMAPRLVADLLRELPNLRFVKEETDFASMTMTQIKELAGDACEGMMGGKGGRHMLDEYRRGAIGTMPACQSADVHVKIWNALDAGDISRAREMYRWLLPLVMFETGYGVAVYKEVLRRRGVIGCAAIRQTGGRVLDALALADLAAILDDLKPLMNADYPARA